MGYRWLPPDPRPSKADAEARKLRKELEKASSFDWIKPILLGLVGINLAINVANDVQKLEAKHEEEEKKKEEEKKRRKERDEKHGRERYDDKDPFRSRRRGNESISSSSQDQREQRRDRSEQPRSGGSMSGGSRRGGSSRSGDNYTRPDDDDRGLVRYEERRRDDGRDFRRQRIRGDDGRVRTFVGDGPPQRPRPRRYSSDF